MNPDSNLPEVDADNNETFPELMLQSWKVKYPRSSHVYVRFLDWSSKNNIVSDAQYGFKPGYGTRDAIFALNGLISKTLKSHKRLYCCFIDYKCAFDTGQITIMEEVGKIWNYGQNSHCYPLSVYTR
jgi:hypothetical protein